ncbi:MAG: alpha/beta hydrolase [Pseudomonadota bacterium]
MAEQFFEGPNGKIAFDRVEGAEPGFVWLGGFRSDMTGGKATHLANWAEKSGRAFLRFDYSGHGKSDGVFEDGCISDWTADAEAVIASVTSGPQILIGSSMGAWIAALLTRNAPDNTSAFVGIAPAPDFTEEIMLPGLPSGMKRSLKENGQVPLPSIYDEAPTIVTQKLFEDGRKNLVLGSGVPFSGKVRILQGMKDPDVPWKHAVRFADAFDSSDVRILLIKDGDHRLSRTQDLAVLEEAIARL